MGSMHQDKEKSIDREEYEKAYTFDMSSDLIEGGGYMNLRKNWHSFILGALQKRTGRNHEHCCAWRI